MRALIPILVVSAALFIRPEPASGNLPRAPWWHVVEVGDERTLKLRSDDGETRTIVLACIGRAKDKEAALTYIKRRLHEQKLAFWALETAHTNWYERPMCLFLDVDLRGGELVYDHPSLNEELLAWGYVTFADAKVSADPYQLKARLTRAKEESRSPDIEE